MRILAVTLLLLGGSAVVGSVQAADAGSGAHYVGGTLESLSAKAGGKILLTDTEAMLFRTNKVSIRVPYERITTLEYGQRVSRRYVSAILVSPVLLLAKKRRHFLTVGYTDEMGRNQAMVFEVEKERIRSVLASLEAKSGRRVEFQDEEARKAGKG